MKTIEYLFYQLFGVNKIMFLNMIECQLKIMGDRNMRNSFSEIFSKDNLYLQVVKSYIPN